MAPEQHSCSSSSWTSCSTPSVCLGPVCYPHSLGKHTSNTLVPALQTPEGSLTILPSLGSIGQDFRGLSQFPWTSMKSGRGNLTKALSGHIIYCGANARLCSTICLEGRQGWDSGPFTLENKDVPEAISPFGGGGTMSLVCTGMQ